MDSTENVNPFEDNLVDVLEKVNISKDLNITKQSSQRGQGTGSFFTDAKYRSVDINRDAGFVSPALSDLHASNSSDIPVKPPRLRKGNAE